MSEKHTCCEMVRGGDTWHPTRRPHGITAKYEHDGKWYCGTHYPPNVAKREAEARARYDAKWAARTPAAGPWKPIAELPDGIPEIMIERDDGWIKTATWEDGVYVTHVCDLETGGCDWLAINPDNFRYFAEIRRRK